jgi:hypothetical protein
MGSTTDRIQVSVQALPPVAADLPLLVAAPAPTGPHHSSILAEHAVRAFAGIETPVTETTKARQSRPSSACVSASALDASVDLEVDMARE